MYKYTCEIDLRELKTNAVSPIDIVETDDPNYTAEKYIYDCEHTSSADADWLNLLYENEVIVSVHPIVVKAD